MLLRICSALLFAQAYTLTTPELAHLSVSVLDMNSAFIPDASIRIESRSAVKELMTRGGDLSFDVPAGEYTITVSGGTFLRYQQEGLKLVSGIKKEFIIRPVPPAPSDQMSVGNPVLTTKVLFLDVMARYSRIKKTGSQVTVSGPYAMIGVQNLFVYAPKIDCDFTTYKCKAEDVTLVDFGSQTFHPRHVSLDAKGKRIQLKLGETLEELSFR